MELKKERQSIGEWRSILFRSISAHVEAMGHGSLSRRLLSIVAIGLCIFLASCSGAKRQVVAHEVGASSVLTSAGFLGVKFKSGHPSVGESFLEASAPPERDQEQALELDAGGLRKVPGVRVEIVGFTDDRECVGQECYELSLRRAKMVHDWFVSRGIPRQSLQEPQGRGAEAAIYDNATEEGRRQNRRVEVNMLPFELPRHGYPEGGR